MYILLCINVFFCTSELFPRPAADLFSCSRLRGTQGVRPITTAQVWALAEVRRTCSGGSQSQVTTGKHSEHVEPSRPMQTHDQVKKCPTAHVIPGILNVVNVVRYYLVMERYFLDTNLRAMRPLLVTISYNVHGLGRIVSSHARSCVEDMTTRWVGLHLRSAQLYGYNMFKVKNSTQHDCCTSMI